MPVVTGPLEAARQDELALLTVEQERLAPAQGHRPHLRAVVAGHRGPEFGAGCRRTARDALDVEAQRDGRSDGDLDQRGGGGHRHLGCHLQGGAAAGVVEGGDVVGTDETADVGDRLVEGRVIGWPQAEPRGGYEPGRAEEHDEEQTAARPEPVLGRCPVR
jgi:hypothetical protein